MASKHHDITAGILVGGHGRRLGGVDKALLQDQGRSFLERTIEALAPEVGLERMALLGREGQRYLATQVPLWPDKIADKGPLGALATLLERSTTPWNLLVACDLPRFDGAIVSHLAAARDATCKIVIARTDDGAHPTAALYHRDLHPDVLERIGADKLALHRLVKDTASIEVPLPAALAGTLLNVNRQADLDRLGHQGVSAARRLLELEEQGLLSRNQNFAEHQKTENRAALRLRRRLEALANVLNDAVAAGDLEVSVTWNENQVDLLMNLRHVHGSYTACLHSDEMALLIQKQGVRDALNACAVDTAELEARLERVAK